MWVKLRIKVKSDFLAQDIRVKQAIEVFFTYSAACFNWPIEVAIAVYNGICKAGS